MFKIGKFAGKTGDVFNRLYANTNAIKSSILVLQMKDDEQIQLTFEILSGGHVIPEESKNGILT